MKNRLRHEFDNVESEVPLTIGFEGFSKTYKADLVVESKAIFELKAVERTVSQHRLQLSKYLFLTNLKHGKLINFSSPKVTGEYVSTTLDMRERKRLSFDTDRFDESDASAVRLRTLMTNLLESWGGFLNLELYYQATEYLLGGIDTVVRPISIITNGQEIGTQKSHLLSDTSAYKITALTKDVDAYREELWRFLLYTRLHSIQWVNLNKHVITFETVYRN